MAVVTVKNISLNPVALPPPFNFTLTPGASMKFNAEGKDLDSPTMQKYLQRGFIEIEGVDLPEEAPAAVEAEAILAAALAEPTEDPEENPELEPELLEEPNDEQDAGNGEEADGEGEEAPSEEAETEEVEAEEEASEEAGPNAEEFTLADLEGMDREELKALAAEKGLDTGGKEKKLRGRIAEFLGLK